MHSTLLINALARSANRFAGTNPEFSENTVEAAWANGCCLFLEVSMLHLHRFSSLLIAGVVLALALPLRAAEVDKYLPQNTEIVVVVNAKQLFDSPLVKKHFLKQIREVIKSNDQTTEILDDLEFDPFNDLTSITVALTMVGSDAKGLIIAHGDFDKSTFEDKATEVAQGMGNVFKIHKEKGCKIFELNAAGGGKALFLGVVDDNTIVAGPEKQYVLDAFAKANGKEDGGVKKEIQELIEQVDPKQSMWFAATASAFLNGDLSRDERARKDLEKVNGITAGITVHRCIRAAFTIAAKSGDSAKALAQEIKMGLEQTKGLLPLLAQQNKELAPVVDTVASLRVSTEGSTVTVRGEITEESVEKGLKELKKAGGRSQRVVHGLRARLLLLGRFSLDCSGMRQNSGRQAPEF
jgi:hypothetical protein